MEEIQIWDGAKRINVFSGLTNSGDFTFAPIPGVSAFHVVDESPPKSTHTMNYGLNIGMKINFIGDSEIQFFSAGASFITSD